MRCAWFGDLSSGSVPFDDVVEKLNEIKSTKRDGFRERGRGLDLLPSVTIELAPSHGLRSRGNVIFQPAKKSPQ